MADYDVVIVGGGPAGLTAGLYTSRAQLRSVLVESMVPSGQAYNSEIIENYPGFPEGISGQELIERFTRQATRFGLEIVQFTKVDTIKADGDGRVALAADQTFSGAALIVATGAHWNTLGIPGETELTGRGISYCATCDGAFFREQQVAVIGGGDTALEDALYLAKIAGKVMVIHRRDQLRAQKVLQQRAFDNPKIEFLWNAVVREVKGEQSVKALVIEDLPSSRRSEVPVDGVFFAIGQRPNSDLVRGFADLDNQGYIITDDNCGTSVPGIFAAGDVRRKGLRQISTAVGDGALAAVAAERYIDQLVGR